MKVDPTPEMLSVQGKSVIRLVVANRSLVAVNKSKTVTSISSSVESASRPVDSPKLNALTALVICSLSAAGVAAFRGVFARSGRFNTRKSSNFVSSCAMRRTPATTSAATSKGLGCVINGQGIMQSSVVREHGNIPEDEVIMTCVAMGWPDPDFVANDVVSRRAENADVASYVGFES